MFGLIRKAIYHTNVDIDLMEENIIQINGGIMIKIDANAKKSCMWKKGFIYRNWKYLASIMDNSAIICDEIIESYDDETKSIPTNFNEEKTACKMQNWYISLAHFINYYDINDSCQ